MLGVGVEAPLGMACSRYAPVVDLRPMVCLWSAAVL